MSDASDMRCAGVFSTRAARAPDPDPNAPRALGVLALAALVAALAVLALCGGCASETVKVVEGTDLSVGFTIPGMEGEANFTVFNYLSGFKTTTAESNRVRLTYTCAESNSYFGAIHTRTAKTVTAEIEPVVDEPEAEAGDEGDVPAPAPSPSSP